MRDWGWDGVAGQAEKCVDCAFASAEELLEVLPKLQARMQPASEEEKCDVVVVVGCWPTQSKRLHVGF